MAAREADPLLQRPEFSQIANDDSTLASTLDLFRQLPA
jgi:hypothetical protein